MSNTLSDLDRKIAASRLRITTLQESIRRDARQFEADKAKLFTADGKQLYNTDLHSQKLKELIARATAAAQTTAAAIAKEQENLNTLAMAARADSLSLMGFSTDELQRATALRPFIEADVKNLDVRNLTANVHAAVNGDDKIAAMLYLRALPARYDAAARGRRDWWDSNLDALYRTLQGDAAKHIDAVEATRQLSIDVQLEAGNFRRTADGSLEAARNDFADAVRNW